MTGFEKIIELSEKDKDTFIDVFCRAFHDDPLIAAVFKGDEYRKKKLRYYFDYKGKIVEFDVFQGILKGLEVAEIEFEDEEEKKNFPIPDFCSHDITQEKFIAGGLICGKSYEDVEQELKRYGYENISQNHLIKKKKKKTFNKNYGVDNIFKHKKFIENLNEIMLKKYGTKRRTWKDTNNIEAGDRLKKIAKMTLSQWMQLLLMENK